jgi:predicted transcriptional regulator
MTKRERLHSLVDSLAEDEVPVAIRFLEFLESDAPSSRLWSFEDAPVDDEPLTEEEQRAMAEAEEDIAQGRVVSHAEARRRLLGDA